MFASSAVGALVAAILAGWLSAIGMLAPAVTAGWPWAAGALTGKLSLTVRLMKSGEPRYQATGRNATTSATSATRSRTSIDLQK
jgi:hypothetical protein